MNTDPKLRWRLARVQKRSRGLSLPILAVLIFHFQFCVFHPVHAQVQVTANFNKWVEYPLVKKIGVYQTPLTCEKWLQRDLPKLAQLEARSLRYEFAWGKDLYGCDAIKGTIGHPTAQLDKADFLFDKAREHTQAFVFAHGYMPSFLQSKTGGLGWQSPPSDYDTWRQVNSLVASHWRQKGYPQRYVEVWNEPDLPGGFFSGTEDDYLRIYEHAALGAKEGDADCKVGGPAIAYMTGWHDRLVGYAKEHSLPLDFLSGHAYGASYTWQLDAMRSALNTLGDNGAEMLLTEYSPYPASDYAANGPVERAEAAMTFFEALPTMLEYTDLTHVTWAQYIDPEEGNTGHAYANWDKLGLVDGNEGCRKALFNAFRLYGMMPARRCQINAGTLKGMASADEDHVAAVVWNPSTQGRRVHLRLTNIPFAEGTVETYHIDTSHNSWYENGQDDLLPTLVSRESFADGSYVVNDSVRSQGVFFIRVSAPDARPSFAYNPFARVIRTHQWYTSRSNAAPYAQFDGKTWTAYLSTNTQSTGWAVVGVTAEDVPETFTVKCTDSGNLKSGSANSALCFRADFQGADGSYVQSVLFHGGLYHAGRSQQVPWGTQRKPDVVVEVPDFSLFEVDLRPYMPAGFTGRVLFTFDMSSTGAGAKANVQLLSSRSPRLSSIQVDSLSASTARLSFLVDGDLPAGQEVGFRLAVDADPLSSSVAKTYPAEVSGRKVTALITDLTLQRHYHVRGFVGEHSTSENAFYTPRLASVTTSPVRCDANRLTVTMAGNVVSENGSKVVHRGFVWCEASESAEPTLQHHVARQGSGVGSFKVEVTDLKPETDYVMRAYALNRAGVAYGRTREFSTRLEDAVQGVVPDALSSDLPFYDLMGRPLPISSAPSSRAIYIKGGKKLLAP